jgi:hypothetical protein
VIAVVIAAAYVLWLFGGGLLAASSGDGSAVAAWLLASIVLGALALAGIAASQGGAA